MVAPVFLYITSASVCGVSVTIPLPKFTGYWKKNVEAIRKLAGDKVSDILDDRGYLGNF
jgi:hypothetical protein